ncbi:MAG TPA: glucose-1-phosphate cytidylyltransferase [Candidatus Binataceae bacterium]|nr:glucose-1-phosphate cytidylyltransferase [Candidatus Binataceae bacterium]
MKVVILAGGLGTRLREETEYKPKPMVEIGGRPIIWHIMKTYAHYGFEDFVICLGYKGDMIRDYFLNYKTRQCDFTVHLGAGAVEVYGGHAEASWRVTLVETGMSTATGGRIKRVGPYLGNSPFMVTYGDGVADIDLGRQLEFHRQRRLLGTVTGVRPASRYGELAANDGLVRIFQEKPQVHTGWINGGFLTLEPAVLDMISGDDDSLESGLLPRLAREGQLAMYEHCGFWQCMDTYREYTQLEEAWNRGAAPWKVW